MSQAVTVADQAHCHQCGAELVGPYCHVCGQPSIAVRRSLRDAMYGQTGRLLHTLCSTYSILITLSAFAYAFAFWLVHRRRNKSWIVHVAAGVQYLCVTFLLAALTFGAARFFGADVAQHPAISVVTLALLAVYVLLTLRRVYGDSWRAAALKTAVVLVIGVLSDLALAVLSLGVALYTA